MMAFLSLRRLIAHINGWPALENASLTDNQLAITCGSASYNTCSLPSMTDDLD